MGPLPANDLDEIFRAVGSLWDNLRGQRIFITGGTGFYGRWLLESFVVANERLNLDCQCTVLTRDPERFRCSAPHLFSQPSLKFMAGDVRDFEFPPGRFDFVIHGATEASAKVNNEEPLRMFDTNVVGTRRTLEFARQCGAKRFLFTSSGAVYGKQPSSLTHVAEDFAGGPDPTDPRNAYAEGKRSAEMMGVLFAKQYGFDFLITRGFAFIGPLLPLDAHFAVGNFIRDGLNGGPIRVAGDGTPYRSYLYASDLAIWLWTILLRGAANRAYNIGNEESGTILELASKIAAFFGTSVVVARQPSPPSPPDRYVPSTRRAREELGLCARVPLADALALTVEWHRAQGNTAQ